MKKLFRGIVLVLTLVMMVTCMCGFTNCIKAPEEQVDLEWEDLPENNNSNLKYFGYFHADGFGSQAPYYDVVDSLENSNVYMINSAIPKEKIKVSLERARASGKKAIVTMHELFVAKTWGTSWLWKDGRESILRENAREIYTNIINDVQEYVDDGTLFAFYFDESMWSLGVTHQAFIDATKMMREVAPNVRILHCMTVYDLGVATFVRGSDGAVYEPITAEVNQYVKDVMYDSYEKWDDNSRQDLLNRLKAVATNNQMIWGCANTHIRTSVDVNEQGNIDTYELKRALVGMYKQAINEPRYAGILGYTMASSDAADFTTADTIGLGLVVDKNSQFYDLGFKKLNINVGRKIIGLGRIEVNE